jgi:hypothetical protein
LQAIVVVKYRVIAGVAVEDSDDDDDDEGEEEDDNYSRVRDSFVYSPRQSVNCW